MKPPIRRAIVIVLDGVGCGALPDAADYGDADTHTLVHVVESAAPPLPHLERWGLGNIPGIDGVRRNPRPEAAFGRMAERSRGKDTTTGHWEIAGLVTDDPFPVFPHGFPSDLIAAFERAVGRGVLGNKPASGTAIIQELGVEHLRTGRLIVYTSADSVFQIAAHADVLSVADLHAACEKARALCDPHRVGRVIARPFVGAPGAFRRTYDRRDFPMPPPAPTLLENLLDAGLPVVGIGKIDDIFAARGISHAVHTKGNTDGLDKIAQELDRLDRGLLFANLVDTDMLYGHRRDVVGFASALAEFDAYLPWLEQRLRPGDLLFVTADHGCDPTHAGTDHTREHVPLLVRGGNAADLGTRTSFADLGQTIAEGAGLPPLPAGTSFLEDL